MSLLLGLFCISLVDVLRMSVFFCFCIIYRPLGLCIYTVRVWPILCLLLFSLFYVCFRGSSVCLSTGTCNVMYIRVINLLDNLIYILHNSAIIYGWWLHARHIGWFIAVPAREIMTAFQREKEEGRERAKVSIWVEWQAKLWHCKQWLCVWLCPELRARDRCVS